MRRRGRIRALVSFNRTDFFLLEGRARGFEAELLQQYEDFLNRDAMREEERVRVVFIPVPFSRLLPALIAGEGDVAAAGLTITPEREALVAFSEPYLSDVDEVVVASAALERAELPVTLEDLAGRRLYVLRASSYAQHLRERSARLEAAGLEPIEIVEADENLGDDDILELVNAGIVGLTVVDSHLAELFAEIFPHVVPLSNLKVNEGGRIAWALRKENPLLRQSLNRFIREARRGTRLGNILFNRYFASEHFVTNPLTQAGRRKLDRLKAVFEPYAERYGFDWLAVAAQAYQESRFDHERRSSEGAVGIMQIMPATAAEIGIEDVDDLERNVHAAVKYLALLRDRHFDEPGLSERDRLAFLWAAYNAGPEKVRAMRERARAMGLDPDRWFFNVEHAALEMAGPETVRHVANTYKYYVAYRLSETFLERKSERIDALSESEQAGDAKTSATGDLQP